MQFQTMSQLGDTLKGIIQISKGSVQILDADHVRGPLIDRLAWTAIFHEKAEMRGTARWIIKMAAPHLGITFHSPESLLRKKKAVEVSVPLISLKGMIYDSARAIFRVAVQKEVGAFIFELPQPEKGVTYPSPSQYVAVIAAAGIQERFKGSLFIDTAPHDPLEKCRREAGMRLSSERPEMIYDRLFSDLKRKRSKNVNRNDEFFLLEKDLWCLPADKQAKICSELEEKFAAFCSAFNLVQSKEEIKVLLRPAESFFSIRAEIEAAYAEYNSGFISPLYKES